MSGDFTITIPAAVGGKPGVANFDAGLASVFAVIAANAAFQVKSSGLGGGKRSMNAGRGFGNADGKALRILTFYNSSGVVNTVTFYYGDERYDPGQTSVISTVQTDIANDIASCVAGAVAQFAKTNGVPGTPVALAAAATYFRKATLVAQKDLAGSANANNVKLGAGAVAGQQPFVLAPGDERVFEAPAGAKWDFGAIYLDVVVAGDGVTVFYS